MNLAILAPSFNCAAKFFRLPGSIWRESKTIPEAWQEVSPRFSVETCARLCKSSCATLLHLSSRTGPRYGSRRFRGPSAFSRLVVRRLRSLWCGILLWRFGRYTRFRLHREEHHATVYFFRIFGIASF